jgi:hypothetical protein
MADHPRRYLTEIASTRGTYVLRVTSLPLGDTDMAPSDLLGDLIATQQLIALPEPGADPERPSAPAPLPAAASRPSHPLPDLWSTASIQNYLATFADDAPELVIEALTRGRVIVETSPARVRRVVTLPVAALYVLANPSPIVFVVTATTVIVVELVGAIVTGLGAGVQEGVQKATAKHIEEIVDRLWQKLRGLPEGDGEEDVENGDDREAEEE